MSDNEFKFFYMDDEQEVISITGQADLTEALNIEDLSSLKLTVAANMQEALKILYESLMESKSLANMSGSTTSLVHQSQLSSARTKASARNRFNSEHDQQLQQLSSSPQKNEPVNQQLLTMPANSADKRQSMPAQFQMQQQDCDSSSYRGSAHGDGQDGEGHMGSTFGQK